MPCHLLATGTKAGRRRAAEAESTVMVLCGLVLILIALLAVATGVATWKWRQVEELRAKYETPPIAAATLSVVFDGPGASLTTKDLSMEELVELVRTMQQATRPATLVGAGANGPIPLLPLLALSMEDSPPAGIEFLIR